MDLASRPNRPWLRGGTVRGIGSEDSGRHHWASGYFARGPLKLTMPER